MRNLIEFLERMGRDPQLRDADPASLAAAMNAAGLSPELREAIAQRDQARLEALLGARTNVICGLFPADDDDKEDEPVPDDDEVRARVAGGR